MKESCRTVINDIEPSSGSLIQKIILNERLVIQEPLNWIRDAVANDNTFNNPKFADAQKYGRSTRIIPEKVHTYHFQGKDVVVERGYYGDFLSLLKANDIVYEIEDQRYCPPASFSAMGDVILRPYQKRTVEGVLQYNQGVVIAPTGSGKTIIGLELIRRMETRALILVHKKELADQWGKEIKKHFGSSPGLIGAGKWSNDENIVVAMVQTLSRDEKKCHQLGKEFGLILCDECHHCPCESFAKVIGLFPCKYKFGLSATPERRDGLDFLIYRNLGPIIASVTKEEVQSVGSIIPAVVKVIRTFFNPGQVNGWQEYVSSLDNTARNLVIIDLISKDRSVLVLTDRICHAKSLSQMLDMRRISHTLAHGELPANQRATLMQRIKDSPITIGTISLLGEGLDVSHWGVLILASPISSEARLLQAIGRILRPGGGKLEGVVYDLHDDNGLSGSSLKTRMKIYKKHNIPVQFD